MRPVGMERMQRFGGQITVDPALLVVTGGLVADGYVIQQLGRQHNAKMAMLFLATEKI